MDLWPSMLADESCSCSQKGAHWGRIAFHVVGVGVKDTKL